jgi:hypothetical protein
LIYNNTFISTSNFHIAYTTIYILLNDVLIQIFNNKFFNLKYINLGSLIYCKENTINGRFEIESNIF